MKNDQSWIIFLLVSEVKGQVVKQTSLTNGFLDYGVAGCFFLCSPTWGNFILYYKNIQSIVFSVDRRVTHLMSEGILCNRLKIVDVRFIDAYRKAAMCWEF